MSTTTIYTNQDTYVRQDEASTNKNGQTYMALGKTGTSTSSPQVDRILMGFDLSSLNGKIIDSATMYLYQDYSTYATSTTLPFTAYCITDSWSAGSVTWSNQPGYSSTAAVSLSLSGNSDGQRSFNITSLIQDIIHNSRTYYGILLKQTNESSNDLRKQFFAEEYSSGSRQAYLSITYHDMNLWGYNSGAFRRAKEVYVYNSGTWRTSKTGSSVYYGGWRSFK